jgi:hypothetical protein
LSASARTVSHRLCHYGAKEGVSDHECVPAASRGDDLRTGRTKAQWTFPVMRTNPQPSREFTYKEFTDFARRFNQDGLLTAVAQRSASLPDGLRELPYRETPPWALAGLVKASICDGNPFRSTALRPGDIRMGCYMYDNLVTHELHQPGLNSPFNILARIAY